MGSERVRIGLGVVLAVVLAGGVLLGSANLRWGAVPDGGAYAGDFVHEYSTAWLVARGQSAAVYDLGSVAAVQHDVGVMGFAWRGGAVNVPYYPPPYYALIAPLARLSYHDAARLWIGLQLLALVAAATCLVGALPALRPHWVWALPATWLFPPLATGLVSGQKGTLWLLVFVGTWRLWRSGRTLAAGAVFGVLALKPPLALALGAVMVARGEGRFLAGAAATGVGLAALTLPLGTEVWAAWLDSVRDPIAQGSDALLAKNHDWLGFTRVALGAYAGVAVAGLTLVLAALTLGALAPAWRRVSAGGLRGDAAFAAATVATVLVSPHLYPYDLTILLLAFAVAGAGIASGALAYAAWLRRALLAVFLLVATVTTTAHPAALLLSVPALFGLQLLLVAAAAAGDPSRGVATGASQTTAAISPP